MLLYGLASKDCATCNEFNFETENLNWACIVGLYTVSGVAYRQCTVKAITVGLVSDAIGVRHFAASVNSVDL